MFLLRRLLPQPGEIGFALLEVAGDAGHEQDEQYGDHGEADPRADDMQVEQAVFKRFAEIQRAINER